MNVDKIGSAHSSLNNLSKTSRGSKRDSKIRNSKNRASRQSSNIQSNRESTVDFVSNRDSFFDDSQYSDDESVMQIKESDEEDSQSADEFDNSCQIPETAERQTFYSQATSNLRGTETATNVDNLYGLMGQIEACVWDNIKLTHLNAKLLEYAKNQAIELDQARSQISPTTLSL